MEASSRATLHFLKVPPASPVTLCIDARFVGGIMQLVRALINNHPLQVISHFGSGGRYPGQFYAPHNARLFDLIGREFDWGG